jgi:hypothetical protein
MSVTLSDGSVGSDVFISYSGQAWMVDTLAILILFLLLPFVASRNP